MGYEHRIYVVPKTGDYDTTLGKYWAEVKFIFNLGKVYEPERIDKAYSRTDCFIYNDDGDEILSDMYGKPLTEVSLDLFIAELRRMVKNGTTSSVFVLLSALETIKQHSYAYGNIVCLHYGY